jgi:Fe-S-cluster containining protein
MARLPLDVERTLGEGEAARTEIVRRFEKQIQSHTSRTKEGVTCSKGCAHCCYHPLSVSLLEGVSLYRWLTEHYLWTPDFKDKVVQHSKAVWGLTPEIWMLSMVACPMLDEKLCSIYQGRPAVCRVTVSTGDPYYCHPHRFGIDVTGIVPRHSFLDELMYLEADLLNRHHQIYVALPLSTALLYGERIAKGDLSLEDSSHTIAIDYRKLIREGP